MLSVSYNDRSTQCARFDTLVKYTVPGQTEKFTLLDLGCGLGDLYNYLQTSGYQNVDYTGLDLVPEMTSAAQKNYPAAKFKNGNFVADDLGNYDIILASGSLNIIFDRPDNQAQHIQNVIEKMYASSRLACAFNLLDKDAMHLYEQDERFYYADKRQVLQFCRAFCPQALLVDGYLVNDFSLILKH
ncbi:SAM-dependent methyltransferases [Candidatus Termititenax aidoneus]|uniref:SAM-dependent methyltransferases n=1 Tax=Termititenax aidoneus TaxID=2218524 RepID=A0A388TCB2_TERA1|nr:SAM-dependent methyltransferases [Candidatus Termititenax aidoneus]